MKIIAVILVIALLMFVISIIVFAVAFHSIDIGWNMNFVNGVSQKLIGESLWKFDYAIDGTTSRSSLDLYLLGFRYVVIASIMNIISWALIFIIALNKR